MRDLAEERTPGSRKEGLKRVEVVPKNLDLPTRCGRFHTAIPRLTVTALSPQRSHRGT